MLTGKSLAGTVVAALTLLGTVAVCGGTGGDSSTRRTVAPGPPLGAGRQKLTAGTHVLDLSKLDQRRTGPSHLPKIEITVPDGWFNYDGWAMSKGRVSRAPVFVTFWDVAGVYPTPCKWKGKPLVDPGTSLAGLAAALAKQPSRRATPPVATALGGHRGRYLDFSVPAGVRFDQCDEGAFESWTANGWSSDRYEQEPGQVDRVWILAVDGQRLVVDASYLPRASARDRAELEHVVNSVRFLD
jgi:hypothetical protein